MIGQSDKLDSLRRAYPLGMLEMETEQGRLWKRRMEQSEHYFKRYSADWADNRALLCEFSRMISEFGTYVALAPAISANFIADVYFRNPDPFIQDKSGNKDLSRILTDVIGSVHAENNTEGEIRHCLQDQWWAGFGGAVGSFKQRAVPETDEQGQPTTEETGEADESGAPVTKPTGNITPVEQKVVIRRVSPWKSRFDPMGRRWDMEDHRYWAYDDVAYLGPLLRDPLLQDEDRARLMAYHSQGASCFSADGTPEDELGYVETDPEFIRVALRTVWSRQDYTIYRGPFGASFTFTPQPWDEEWERADLFPYHYMPVNRIPEDQQNTQGFIGLPYLTLIGQHIRNINKAQGLLLNALGKVIDVYITYKGLFDGITQAKVVGSDREFTVIQVDPKELLKFPSAQDGAIPLKDAMHLLPVGDTKDMQHMATIDHEFNMIAQIIGQGPAERGGISQSDTATESLGIQQGLSRRMSSNRNDAGRHYNAISKMIFLILQARQTLPMRYQMTTAGYDQKVWETFTDPHEQLKDLDIHFAYATGSTEPQTREQTFALRERMFTILQPILQAQGNTRLIMKLAQDLIEPLNIIDSDLYFNDVASQIVMQLLAILMGLGKGQILADDPQAIAKIPELISQLAQAILTPQELAQVSAAVNGGQVPEGGDAGQGVGSLPKALSPGQASFAAGAAGSAAAGKSSGIQFSEALPAPALQNTPT